MTITVVGSANLDLVYRVKRHPLPGETVLAMSADAMPGGKGSNQAIAAARAGAEVVLIAALGRDAAGDRLAGAAHDAAVTVLDRRVDAATGTALITVDARGENSIVVDAGANALLNALTSAERDAVARADVVLLQLEIPLATVAEAARIAHESGGLVILNASPVQELSEPLLRAVDILIVNEHEAALLEPAAHSPQEAAKALARQGRTVVLTLGGAGSLVVAPGVDPVAVPAHTVTVVDTTGAGDTFCGALAAEIDRRPAGSDRVASAARFASVAAALSVQRSGAVPSIPTLEEIRAFRAER